MNNPYQPPKRPPNQAPLPPLQRPRPTYGGSQPSYPSYEPEPYWEPPRRYIPPRRRRRVRIPCLGCLMFMLPILLFVLALGLYFLFPMRTNILIMGIDYAEPPSYVARTDTLILTTVEPWEPYVGMLSIPRDLWVMIPGVGENRINTAHFYAEAAQPGSGPRATMDTVAYNFGVNPDYYIRIRFEGFREVVDAMGGVVIELPEPMAGYPAGTHFLAPRKALAFVRHRATSDDFHRMSNGQFMMRAILKNMLLPRNWPNIPGVLKASMKVIETDIPLWLWPRLALAVMRVGPDGIDSHVINREMVTSFITNQGADVLSPDWLQINLLVDQMFKR
jgi:LCP family protein required for cell wall assembly